MSLNKVMLIGNVGKDPEVRYIENANGRTKVATLTLATTERYKDRNGNLKENTEWHNLVAWRGTADIIENYVKKGTQIFVEGRLRTRSWEDANNVKKYTTEILVDTLQLLGRKSDNPSNQQGSLGNGVSNTLNTASSPIEKTAPISPVVTPASTEKSIVTEDSSDDLPF